MILTFVFSVVEHAGADDENVVAVIVDAVHVASVVDVVDADVASVDGVTVVDDAVDADAAAVVDADGVIVVDVADGFNDVDAFLSMLLILFAISVPKLMLMTSLLSIMSMQLLLLMISMLMAV